MRRSGAIDWAGATVHSAASRSGSGRVDIDLDNLTSPRLTEVQRQILEFTRSQTRRIQLRPHARGSHRGRCSGRRSGRRRRLWGSVGRACRRHRVRRRPDPADPLVATPTNRAPTAQPAVADRADQAISRDRVDSDPSAVHRRRDAAVRDDASGQPHRRRSSSAGFAVLGKPRPDPCQLAKAPTTSGSIRVMRGRRPNTMR